MHYSNIGSRAGLVALVFALIIPLVSAIPIPAAGYVSSTLSSSSNPSLNGLPEVDTVNLNLKILLSGRMSTLPTATRALARRVRYLLVFHLLAGIYWASLIFLQQDISTNMDDQLVRRSVGSKIHAAFEVYLKSFPENSMILDIDYLMIIESREGCQAWYVRVGKTWRRYLILIDL